METIARRWPGWATSLALAVAVAAIPSAALATAASRIPGTPATGAVGPTGATPADMYGPLFRAVQLGHVFTDGKTFADAAPRRDPAAILAAYRARPSQGRDALRAFVLANFAVPIAPPTAAAAPTATPRLSLRAHIAALWPVLTRPPAPVAPGGSALPLPAAAVVPGGRFREIYYWDSYFTMLGLARDGRADLVESMIDDFTTLIERYGHIPNGTRSYYLSRSQPPVYSLMLGLSRVRDPQILARRLAALRREHAYWMQGAAGLAPGHAAAHVVRLADGTLLNRYWDARATPREESYAEDVATAARSARPAAETWRDLRAAAESGWDFSSRWLGDGRTLATIRTTAIAPVDLNSLLYGMERTIAQRCAEIGDAACTRDYDARATARGAAIRRLMWNSRDGRFADLDWQSGRQTPLLSAATLFPLFTGIARPDQARRVAATVRAQLLAPGGLRTSTQATGQQWDGRNGWAPLQWIAVTGLRRNGQPALARTIADRWIATVDSHYRATGRIVEKYDVTVRRGGGGGEYPLQDGFGWTNGVTRALIADYGDAKPAAAR